MSPTKARCPVEVTLEVIAGKWKAVILWYLMQRPMRFGQLKREIRGITQRMLAQQLRELERHGIVSRTVLNSSALHVEYSMTPFGTTLCPVLRVMCEWGERYAARLGTAHASAHARCVAETAAASEA